METTGPARNDDDRSDPTEAAAEQCCLRRASCELPGWRAPQECLLNLADVLRQREMCLGPAADAPALDDRIDSFGSQPDVSRTLRTLREWHSRLRQALPPQRKPARETYYAFVRSAIMSPCNAVADLLAQQGVKAARITCVCRTQHVLFRMVRIDVRFSLASMDALQRLLSKEGVPLLPGLAPAVWVATSPLQLAWMTGIKVQDIAGAHAQPTPQGPMRSTGVSTLLHRRRMRRTASRAVRHSEASGSTHGPPTASPPGHMSHSPPNLGAYCSVPQSQQGFNHAIMMTTGPDGADSSYHRRIRLIPEHVRAGEVEISSLQARSSCADPRQIAVIGHMTG